MSKPQEHHDQLHIQYLEDRNKQLTEAFLELLESSYNHSHEYSNKEQWLELAGIEEKQDE